MQFSKGDRVRIKQGAWYHPGELGTVQELDESTVRVAFDDPQVGECRFSIHEVEGVEKAKPTKPTPFSKGDRVRVKVAGQFHPGDTGTVQWCGESTVRVDFDGPQEEVEEYPLARVEKIEEARPTDSIQVDNVVNHPPHYTGFSNGSEVIDITECLAYNRGNAIKYLARAGKKDPSKELQDLKKALWFVAREIERMEKSEKKEEAK